MIQEFYTDIPVYDADSQTWTKRNFDTHEDFRKFILTLFKVPGEYAFDETSLMFKEQAFIFDKRGYYCDAPFRSKDFVTYWDAQKERCRKGVIYLHKGKTWFLTRQYYMWLNFLPITDKKLKKLRFPDVMDAQYHMALYELLAELHFKHAIILKKRQFGSSFFHAARLLNKFVFEEALTLKMGAELKNYVNTDKGTWAYLNEYRNFLNEHTAWVRPCDPDKDMSWQQRIEVNMDGKKVYKGNRCRLTATSFEKSATAGVGGPCEEFFYEEAGIAPKIKMTYGFMGPALKAGMITTGIFIAAGSVGDLTQCEGMKEYLEKPRENDFYGVETNLVDEDGTIAVRGLFIPEQWSMAPYVDVWGNSMVADALEALDRYFLECKKNKTPEDYQLEVSQHPRNIAEAFAARTASKFPLHLVTQMERKIKDGKFHMEHTELIRTLEGKIEPRGTRRIPIRDFPFSMKSEVKEGVLEVYERPDPTAPWGTYFASIDPVSEGKTVTSESLCTIYVYKMSTEVTVHKADGTIERRLEPGRMVAAWCGRYDDINDTHEHLEKIIEWYNAWTLVEANVSLFIQYMIGKRKQKYLVPKDQILFLKEVGANAQSFQDFGWKNAGVLFKTTLLSYGIEALKEKIDQEFDEQGEETSCTFGIERFPDVMLMAEMRAYRDGLNVDRLIAYCALMAFVAVQESNRGVTRRVDREKEKTPQPKSGNLNRNPFHNMGSRQPVTTSSGNRTRGAFKNFR